MVATVRTARYSQRPMGQEKARPRALTPIQQPQAVQRLPARRSHPRQISRRWRYCESSTMPQPSPTKATTDWKRFAAWVASGGKDGLRQRTGDLPWSPLARLPFAEDWTRGRPRFAPLARLPYPAGWERGRG